MTGAKIALLLAAAAIGPASAPSAAPAPVAVDFAEAVGVCRLAFVEQLRGEPPRQASARLQAMPAAARPTVQALCAAYAIGQQDLATAIAAARDAQPDQGDAPATPQGQPI